MCVLSEVFLIVGFGVKLWLAIAGVRTYTQALIKPLHLAITRWWLIRDDLGLSSTQSPVVEGVLL